jgi:hypothetical protein
MIGGLLISSGGADAFANAMISIGGRKYVPWTLFFAAFLIGLPLFFEVGFVLLGTQLVPINPQLREEFDKARGSPRWAPAGSSNATGRLRKPADIRSGRGSLSPRGHRTSLQFQFAKQFFRLFLTLLFPLRGCRLLLILFLDLSNQTLLFLGVKAIRRYNRFL